MGNSTAHGGVIVAGDPRVLIGDKGKGDGRPAPALAGTHRAALTQAASSGAPFCEECEAARRELARAPVPGSVDPNTQRIALRSAAVGGHAFCAECERARREMTAPPDPGAAQGTGLREAAISGAAFCEECERAAAAAHA
jgi:hypothetical protein